MQDKSTLSVKTFDVGPMLNIVYLIWDNTTKDAAIVDPAWDLTEVLNFTTQNGLKLRKILLTHSHHDHVNSIDTLLNKYDLPIYINKFEASFWKKKYDNLIITGSNDTFSLGKSSVSTIHTHLDTLLALVVTYSIKTLLQEIHYLFSDVEDVIFTEVTLKKCTIP